MPRSAAWPGPGMVHPADLWGMMPAGDAPSFPLYRRSANGLNWYRVESWTAFTEVQRVGGRYIAHRVQAKAYPERVRLQGLVDMTDGHVQACPAAEVEDLLAASA